MRKAMTFVGKALLLIGFLVVCLSAGSSYSERISEIAKGQGQHSMRRAVSPVMSMEGAVRN